MAKTGSYIKLDRGLKTNPLWLERPFSKGQAWVDLLLLAQGVDKEKSYRGKIQKQKSGTVYTSILYLSNRWGWGRARVYRFLDSLINLGMVEVQGWTSNDTSERTRNSTTNGTIITIEKWALYQHGSTNDDTSSDTSERTSDDTHNRKHIRESNKEKAYKEKPLRGCYPYPCGLWEKPKWMTEEEWEQSKYLTADNIPGLYRGEYDSIIDYLHDKKKGCLK